MEATLKDFYRPGTMWYIWRNRPSLVMTSDMGMETMSDPGGMRDAATNPLPEWGRRERVRGAAGRHPPLEDIH